MKKVLILAYDFPPYVSVGGLRPYNWYTYLKEFNIEPIVITRQWENKYGNELDYVAPSIYKETITESGEFGTIIYTPYKPNLANRLLLKHGRKKYALIRRIISLYFEITQFLWTTGPKKQIYKEAKKYLQQNQVDVIIATGDPFVLFHYANILSKINKTPWIADYRDPWSFDMSMMQNGLFRSINRLIENKTIKNAASITVVSDFIKLDILTLVNDKPIHIIENGYNPEIIEKVKDIPQQSNQLSIALIGSTYKWHPLESFISVLNQFNINNPENQIQLNLYGVNNSDEIKNIILTQYPLLEKKLTIFSKMSNEKLLANIMENNIMLLFNYYSFMGTKIFDYIAIKRKILFCYSEEPKAMELKEKYYTVNERPEISNTLQQDLIETKNAGIIIKNETHLLNVLNDLKVEFINDGEIKCNSKPINEYSRRNQTKKLAELIHEII